MKIIKYSTASTYIKDDFVTSKSQIPQWYKDIIANRPFAEQSLNQATVKKCLPFFDALTNGYMILTTQDLLFTQNIDSEFLNVQWAIEDTPSVVVDIRQHTSYLTPPLGHSSAHAVWRIPFTFKTPKGWSILITHPLNRTDLPFTTTSGIVDSDKFPMYPGDIPFFIKSNFNGILPAGTPIAQMIFIKRESWYKKYSVKLNEEGKFTRFLNLKNNTSYGHYRKNIWQRKEAE
jgi:hypothetical protein